MPSRDRFTEVLLLTVALIWASNYPLMKYGLIVLDAFVFNSIRFIVAFALLVVILRVRSLSIKVEPSDRKKILQLGFIVSIVYQCAFIIGLKNTTSGNAAVILSTSPIWTVCFNARLNRERIFPQMWLGLVLSLVGIVLIIVGSNKMLEVGIQAIIGDLLALLSAMLWGLNTTLQKPLLMRYTTIELSVMTLGIGAIGLTLIAIPSAVTMNWTSVPFSYILAAILSGVLSIGIANVLWSFGVKKIGPSRTASFNNLVPIFAFMIAYVTLGEKITELQLLGAGVTIIGVWIVSR